MVHICTRRSFGRLLCAALYFFFSGVEYAVILPTLNEFLGTMNAPSGFIGITMASFSFTGLIAAPIFGHFSDKTGSAKLSVIISNLFEIGGNFLYFAGGNFYLVWVSRLIAGIGSGASSSILGMLSRITTEEERTSVFSLLMSLRQVGLLIGPGLNIFLSNLDFEIGPFVVNQYTSPGLLMVAIWFFHTLLVLVLFQDAQSIRSGEELNRADQNVVSNMPSGSSQTDEGSSPYCVQAKTLFNEFLREEVSVCLVLTFMVMFAQTGLEAAVTPLTFTFFHWGALYNSFMYSAAGLLVIVVFCIMFVLSKYFADRLILLVGCGGLISTYVVLFAYSSALLQQTTGSTGLEAPSWLLPLFCFDIFLFSVSLPLVWATLASLFSKVTSMENQGFNQGIRLVFMGLGQIIGPIWAASLANIRWLPIMAGVNLFLICLFTTMLCMSYSKLQSPPSIQLLNAKSDLEEAENESEGTPLLKASSNPTAYA